MDIKSYADHDIEVILLGNKCDVKKDERVCESAS